MPTLSPVAFSTQAEEQAIPSAQTEMTQLAGADFWRQVKEGQEGYTTSQFPEHGVLISTPGETWYILKEKWMSPAGAVAIFGSIAMVILAYIFVGPLMLSKPRTGKKLKRCIWVILLTCHWLCSSPKLQAVPLEMSILAALIIATSASIAATSSATSATSPLSLATLATTLLP